ncbi:MAG TPA: deoxyribodipyrimidine photo-lyase, partial [Gemmatales bacterium]|nr:deoxyribodipyrimidine photo-lyase [Gemmatales bacterium]
MATLVWFRTDLRLADNPALHHAHSLGQPIIPVYIWEPSEEGDWPLGGASKWWLHHSLAALEQSLTKLGSRLTILRGPSLETLQKLIAEHG